MKRASYADSSFIMSLVSIDFHSEMATAHMRNAYEELAFTLLHRIEVRNALRNARGRGDILEDECQKALKQIEEDLRDGLLIHTEILWVNIFRRADDLSEKYATTNGQRTLDLLHIAIALELNSEIFLSFDKRQRRLAKEVVLL